MKIFRSIVGIALICMFTLVGCESTPEEIVSKRDNILFGDEHMYAVAYLGYEEIEDVEFYLGKYLDEETLPIHYFSNGEYYLIIPRYEDMTVQLYENDFDTMEKNLIYEDKSARPFIVQCNISDIFSDATIAFTYQGETVEFSPYISLKDGSVVVGDKGLNVTKE